MSKKAEMALCDMVGQHCASNRQTENGALIVEGPIVSADEEAIDALVSDGYMEGLNSYAWAFTEKAGIWGPK